MSRHRSNAYAYEDDEDFYYTQEDYNNEFYYQDQGRQVVHNFSELYRRPDGGELMPLPVKKEQRRYKSSAYIPPEYFYNQMIEEKSHRKLPKSNQFYTIITPEEYAYRQHEKQANSKKYPITVKTPRFFKRCPASSTVYKRPSTLCLPVISQPDPAVNTRRFKKENIPFEPSLLSRQHQLKVEMEPCQIDSEGDGDVNVKTGHLEKLLAQYEQESTKCDLMEIDSKSDLAKMAKFMKPRVPSSIRLKQERQKRKSLSNFEITKIPSTQVMANETTMGPDTLDKLLNQLKKCEVGRSKSKETETENELKNVTSTEQKEPSQSQSKLFNYQDIQDQWRKSQTNCIKSKDSFQETQKFPKSAPLDDNCALELHRSKSYIVNLIDRALSKELGTIPCERFQQKPVENMTTKRAIDLVNRHCSNDQNITIKYAPGVRESSMTNVIKEPLRSSPSISSKSCCQDEPSYIKQLRQLRWGHLKHIQREVKRLEDLERFLDECTQNDEE